MLSCHSSGNDPGVTGSPSPRASAQMKPASSPLSSHCTNSSRHHSLFPVSLRLQVAPSGMLLGDSFPDLQNPDPACAQLSFVIQWRCLKQTYALLHSNHGQERESTAPTWTVLQESKEHSRMVFWETAGLGSLGWRGERAASGESREQREPEWMNSSPPSCRIGKIKNIN